MRILMDVTSLMEKELTGVGVYIKNLIMHLQRSPDIDIAGTWYAEKFKKKGLIPSHVAMPLTPYFRFFSALNFGRYDIFHGPNCKLPLSRFYKKVVTVHDLVDYEDAIIDKKRAEYSIGKYNKLFLDCRPDRIITVSNFTRNYFLERFPQFESITRTIHLGIDHIETLPDALAMRPYEFPYILFVGTNDKRKNLIKVVEAYEIAKERVSDLHLVIVGNKGYHHEIADEKIERSRFAGHIHRLGFIDNEKLVNLYYHAEAFVFPSLYEGFGIPILEAMRIGCPVITSNCGAMKEVAGNAAILISPNDADEISQDIIKLVSDKELRKGLIEKGRKWSDNFTWDRCSQETIAVYKELIY